MNTIYLTPTGRYSLHDLDGDTPVQARFIHTRSQGDFNVITYLSSRKNSTKTETREQVFFICEEGKEKDREHQMKIDAEFKRGETFFTKKDGFLFGAYHALTKLGTIIKIAV